MKLSFLFEENTQELRDSDHENTGLMSQHIEHKAHFFNIKEYLRTGVFLFEPKARKTYCCIYACSCKLGTLIKIRTLSFYGSDSKKVLKENCLSKKINVEKRKQQTNI